MQKYKTLLVREQLDRTFEQVIDRECDNPERVYEIMKLLHADMQPEEHMWVVHFNVSRRITGVTEVSIGALAHTVADPAQVFRTAILAGSAAIVLVHNHPSGDATPSSADLDTTKRLVQAGKTIGIPVTDHIVLGDDYYVSMYGENPVLFLGAPL